MVSPLGASTSYGEPGAFDSLRIDNDFEFGNSSGTLDGPTTEQLSLTPTFDYGEIWHIKIRLSVIPEPTEGVVMLRLEDEEEDDFLQQAIIPDLGGNECEINTILDWRAVDWDSGVGSPDLFIVVTGDEETMEYVCDSVAIRLREESDVSTRSTTGTGTSNFDP